MADPITNERLREIVVNGTYCGLDEGHSIAAELLTARVDLREAVQLLDMAEPPPDHENGGDLELWNRRRAVLRGVVEKRKETP